MAEATCDIMDAIRASKKELRQRIAKTLQDLKAGAVDGQCESS